MSDTSRRGFLAIAGVGAAGVAVASVAGAAASTSNSAGAGPVDAGTKLPAGASGSLVAYVSDVHNGHVAVLVGETEVQVTDHELVARLAQVAGTASKKAGA